MDTNDVDNPAADMEMSATEAAAYLSGLVGYSVSAEVLDSLNALGRGPVADNSSQNPVYRRSALDAFLRENGTDPMTWMAGAFRNFADQYHAVAADHPELQSDDLADRAEKLRSYDGDDWDPDQAK